MSDIPTQLGPYTIEREIGRGGMGVVYLGRDTKLDRPVAIKALPEHLAHDADRLARFEREARTLAQLSHPNIAGVYSVEELGERRFIVMEHAEGQTLEALIGGAGLDLDEALGIAGQIAAGLEAAHDAGIIHRDIKPGNIMVAPGGRVRVLDFGLARASESAGASTSHLQTATTPGPITQEGTTLGTPAYMSPEQVRGRELDRRTDVWSFGCVLYEMLSGRRAFAGDTLADVTVSVLGSEPDLSALRGGEMPEPVMRVLGRCLVKDPAKRLRDFGDARLDLEDALAPDAAQTRGAPEPARGLGPVVPAIAGAVVGAALVGALMWTAPRPSGTDAPTHLSLMMPHAPGAFSYFLPTFVTNEDASAIAFISEDDQGVDRLILRRLDDPEPRVLVDSGPAPESAAFSPDGAWIAYSRAEDGIFRVSTSGGPSERICEFARIPGIVWTRDGRLIFGSGDDGKFREVSSSGGEPRLIDIDFEDGVIAGWPDLVRNDEVLLYTCGSRTESRGARWIEAYDFGTGARTRLVEDAFYPRYLSSGHLLFQRDGTIMAVPLDIDALETTGPARAVAEATPLALIGAGAWDASSSGALFVMGRRPNPQSELLRVSLDGSAEPVGRQRPFLHHLIQSMRLSPDATSVAGILLGDSLLGQICIYDLERDLIRPLRTDGASQQLPVWSPDGEWIYYSQYEIGGIGWQGLYRRRPDGTGQPELLSSGPPAIHPHGISPDGRTLVATVSRSDLSVSDSSDIAIVDLSDPELPIRLLTDTPYDERVPRLSPDGAWVAYESNEPGTRQVFVRPIDAGSGRTQVSTDRGVAPAWSPDGGTIYFGDTETRMVMAASFEAPADDPAGSPQIGAPREIVPALSWRFVEDVFPEDGQLLMIDDVSDRASRSTLIDVVLNVDAALEPAGD